MLSRREIPAACLSHERLKSTLAMPADSGVTWLHDRVSADNVRLWHFAFALFAAVYIAILFLHVGHGLASVDGHGAIKATTELVQHHRLEISRPPGHPTTEFY